MADYLVRGTKDLRDYMRTLNTSVPLERVAASLGIPVIHLSKYDGQADGSRASGRSFERKVSQAQADSCADILGVTVANLVTNANFLELP